LEVLGQKYVLDYAVERRYLRMCIDTALSQQGAPPMASALFTIRASPPGRPRAFTMWIIETPFCPLPFAKYVEPTYRKLADMLKGQLAVDLKGRRFTLMMSRAAVQEKIAGM
jgi:hypothetical protein